MNQNFNPEYEFLKDIYDEKYHPVNMPPLYEDAYEKEGKIIKCNSGSAYLISGDWRPVIKNKYPYLIFLTCFKLSDTIVEDILIKNKNLIQFNKKCLELDKIILPPENLGIFSNNDYYCLFKYFYKEYFIARNKIIHSTSYSIENEFLKIKWIDKNTCLTEEKHINISDIGKLAISLLLAYKSIGNKYFDEHLTNKSIYYLGDFLYAENSIFKINKYWNLKLEKRMDDFILYDYNLIKKSLEEPMSNLIIRVQVETKKGNLTIDNEKITNNPNGIFLSHI